MKTEKLEALRLYAKTLADEAAKIVDALADDPFVRTGRLAEAIRHVREELPPEPAPGCSVGGCEKPPVVGVDWVGPPKEEWFRFCEDHDPRKLGDDAR